jgi:hypothetical protein
MFLEASRPSCYCLVRDSGEPMDLSEGTLRDSAQQLHHHQRVEDAPVLAGKAIVAEPGDVDQLDVDALAAARLRTGHREPMPSRLDVPNEREVDAVGAERALVGSGGGGQPCAMFAATYPERTRALILVNTPARAGKAEDYPYGLEPDAWREQLREVRQRWGEREYFEQQARRSNPSADDKFVDWFVTCQRFNASPGAALNFYRYGRVRGRWGKARGDLGGDRRTRRRARRPRRGPGLTDGEGSRRRLGIRFHGPRRARAQGRSRNLRVYAVAEG